MAVIPYTDWSSVSQLREEINRLFGTVDKGDTSGATASWIPAVDIFEYDNRFELMVDLPGVDPKDVEMTLDRGVLTLTGERAQAASRGYPSMRGYIMPSDNVYASTGVSIVARA